MGGAQLPWPNGAAALALTVAAVCVITETLCQGLQEPRRVQAYQTWPGEVEVVWKYDDIRNMTFVIHYVYTLTNGLTVFDIASSVDVFERRMATISHLRSRTTYTISIEATRGYNNDSAVSNATSIYVREGVPWTPYNLSVAHVNISGTSYLLTWKSHDHTSVDQYRVEWNTENSSSTVSMQTIYRFYHLSGLREDSLYVVRVYAENKVGSSQPASLVFHTLGTNALLQEESTLVYSELPADEGIRFPLFLYVVGPVAGFTIVISLLVGLAMYRKRKAEERAAESADPTSYEPLRHKSSTIDDDINLRCYTTLDRGPGPRELSRDTITTTLESIAYSDVLGTGGPGDELGGAGDMGGRRELSSFSIPFSPQDEMVSDEAEDPAIAGSAGDTGALPQDERDSGRSSPYENLLHAAREPDKLPSRTPCCKKVDPPIIPVPHERIYFNVSTVNKPGADTSPTFTYVYSDHMPGRTLRQPPDIYSSGFENI